MTTLDGVSIKLRLSYITKTLRISLNNINYEPYDISHIYKKSSQVKFPSWLTYVTIGATNSRFDGISVLPSRIKESSNAAVLNNWLEQ